MLLVNTISINVIPVSTVARSLKNFISLFVRFMFVLIFKTDKSVQNKYSHRTKQFLCTFTLYK